MSSSDQTSPDKVADSDAAAVSADTDGDSRTVKLDTVWESDGKPMFLDRQGKPLTLRSWSELRSDTPYRTIERTTVGAYEAITAWLGTDQGDSLDDTPPLIFGTISRHIEEATFNEHSERFAATETEARHNHYCLVATLTAET